MKTFKRYGAARKAAGGAPIVRIDCMGERLHVVGYSERVSASLCEVSLIGPKGDITGHVTLGHLDRLGNANYATAGRPYPSTAFPKEV